MEFEVVVVTNKVAKREDLYEKWDPLAPGTVYGVYNTMGKSPKCKADVKALDIKAKNCKVTNPQDDDVDVAMQVTKGVSFTMENKWTVGDIKNAIVAEVKKIRANVDELDIHLA